MKKFLLIAAMASFALGGCTKDESVSKVEQREIGFSNPYVNKVTRAGDVYGELGEVAYPTAENFSVFAVWHLDEFAGWEKSSLYMDDVETAYDDTFNGWRPITRHYWPKNGYLTFAAYSPTGAVSADHATYAADGLTLSGFNTGNDNAKHIDLMYSQRSYNKKKTDTDNINEPYDQVDIDFQHALSSIHFTAKLDQSYNGTTITLKKISIYGVNTQADFKENVDQTTPGTYTSTPAWINHSSYNQIVPETSAFVYYNNSQVLTDAKWEIKDQEGQVDIIALPQTLPDGATIKIEYTIDAPGDTTLAINQVNTVKISDLSTKTWEPGKRYIYNMTFSFDEIYFAPEILNWTIADETEVKVEDYQ